MSNYERDMESTLQEICDIVGFKMDGGKTAENLIEFIRARQAPAPVEVSMLADKLKAWIDLNVGRAAEANTLVEDIDRLATMASMAFTPASEVPAGQPTDEQIHAAWRAWPKTSITSHASAVAFVRSVLAATPASPATEGEAVDVYADIHKEQSKRIGSVLSIKGAVRANLSPKAMDMLQRGADALSLEERQSKAEKAAAIANIPLAAPIEAEAQSLIGFQARYRKPGDAEWSSWASVLKPAYDWEMEIRTVEAEAQKPTDFPLGAIINGRTHAERLETTGFECEGGNLLMCSAWMEFRRCFEHLADYVSTMQPAGEAQKAVAWEPWLLYLSDRADGVKGHFAIARWNPRGFREVWNLHTHEWAAFSDDVLTRDQAEVLLQKIVLPTSSASTEAVALTDEELYSIYRRHYPAPVVYIEGDLHGPKAVNACLHEVQRALAKKNGWRLGGAEHG